MFFRSILPREHGAWAMWIIPYSIGCTTGEGISLRSIFGFLGILFFFLSRRPLQDLLKNRLPVDRERGMNMRHMRLSFIILASMGEGLHLWLIIRYRIWGLFVIGLVALGLISFHTHLSMKHRERTLGGEILGVAILTLSAPAAFLISGSALSFQALLLWGLNWLYFSGSVFYIKMRKKAIQKKKLVLVFPRNLTMVKECLAYIFLLTFFLALLAFTRRIPVLITLSFVPMIAHTLWSVAFLKPRFAIIKQGLIQTHLALIYAFLFVLLWP